MQRTSNKDTLRQVLFWCILWASVLLMLGGLDFSAQSLLRLSAVIPGVALSVWLNLALLLPRFYFKKRYALYALSAVVLLILLARATIGLSLFFMEGNFLPDTLYTGRPGGGRGAVFFVPIVISVIGSTLYEISLFAARKEQEAAALRSEKLETEMKFLKSQINPHFLFNALNNIYTQAVLKTDDAPENLLKLSTMLRYVLYDCNAARVPLRKELEYIRHYIDLFRLKDSGGIDIRADLDDSRPELLVAPLIFIPFIENAFKHGDIEKIGKGWIDIRLTTNERSLVFEVKNSLPEVAKSKDKVGGIGLENVRRQLELIYPAMHRLEIRPGAERFEVLLEIYF